MLRAAKGAGVNRKVDDGIEPVSFLEECGGINLFGLSLIESVSFGDLLKSLEDGGLNVLWLRVIESLSIGDLFTPIDGVEATLGVKTDEVALITENL